MAALCVRKELRIVPKTDLVEEVMNVGLRLTVPHTQKLRTFHTDEVHLYACTSHSSVTRIIRVLRRHVFEDNLFVETKAKVKVSAFQSQG